MNRFLSLLTIAFILSSAAKAQQWAGAATTTSSINREGNVGIGTTVPDQRLTIKGGGIGFDGNSGDKKLYSPSDGVLEWMTHDLAAERAFAVSHQGTQRVYLSALGHSYLMGGNLGLGTKTPGTKLDVGGVIRTFNKDNAAAYWDNISLWSDGANAHIQSDGDDNGLHISSLTGGKIILESKVGIGTSNPVQKLDVIGNVNAGEPGLYWQGFRSNAPSRVWGFQQNDQMMVGIGGDVYNRGFSANAMGIFNGSTTKEDIFLYNQNSPGADFIVLKNSGNVGIGTLAPISNLQIESAGTKTSLRIRHRNEQQADWGLELSQDANLTGSLACPGRDLQLQGGWDKNIILGAPENSTYGGKVVVPGASVSIGTTDPKGYKLAVNGSAVFTKAVVRQYGNWPDYVFEPTYQLPSLTEVEAFIKQHKHLPDVPSAKEIADNGLDLGDNQAILLKKIEELTLYIINLNKNVEEQKTKMEEQAKEIEQLKKGKH